MKLTLYAASIFLFLGCARMQTLNMEPHKYSERPEHIVWIQVAGFSEEHLPLLRLNNPEVSFQTNLEQVDCMGKMWNYNFYQLRPNAFSSFVSQINGSQNIKNSCEDYTMIPAWEYLREINYDVSLLENGADTTQSLDQSLGCSNNKMLNLNHVRFYKMGQVSKAEDKTFHYQDSLEEQNKNFAEGIYYDRSCQRGICFSSLSNNFRSLWKLFTKDRAKTFFLVRDFNFQKALKKKDIGLAKESLHEIDKLIAIIKAEEKDGVLVIVTGAEPMPIEFPKSGKEWVEFERSGKNIVYKNTGLLSPVLAKGAMAENFCGIFNESEVLKRVLFKPEEKKFNLDYLHPF